MINDLKGTFKVIYNEMHRWTEKDHEILQAEYRLPISRSRDLAMIMAITGL
jgi:hypothetical protein